jgi:ribosomal protein S27AE
MNPTLFEIGMAIFMVAVSVALVVWFSRYVAAASGRRMMHMLTLAGVDPEVAKHGDTEAIIQDVRSRCGRCRFEDLCDRWLAGKVEGDNSFCPNAQIFDLLKKTTGRIAP